MILLSKILKAGSVTFLKEKLLYTDVVKPADEEYEPDENETEEDIDEPPKETPEQHAQKILEQARFDAETVLREAKKKAEKEAEVINGEAWEQGYQEGMDLATAEGDAIKAQAQKVLLDAEEERKKIIDGIEAEIIDLVIRITGKLIDDTFQINPQIITVLIKKGLYSANLTGEVSVHVSPADYDTAIENKTELLAVTDSSTRLEIMKDESLNPMDCVIETPFGSVDCSLNAGYEALSQNLRYILGGKPL